MTKTSTNVGRYLSHTIEYLFLVTCRKLNSVSEFYRVDSFNSDHEQLLTLIRDATKQLPPRERVIIEQRYINKS